jgi:hypothetical protein
LYKIEFNTITFNWVYAGVITTQSRILLQKAYYMNLVYPNLMTKLQKKSLDSSPDETQIFENGKMELAKLMMLQSVGSYWSQAGVGKNP